VTGRESCVTASAASTGNQSPHAHLSTRNQNQGEPRLSGDDRITADGMRPAIRVTFSDCTSPTSMTRTALLCDDVKTIARNESVRLPGQVTQSIAGAERRRKNAGLFKKAGMASENVWNGHASVIKLSSRIPPRIFIPLLALNPCITGFL
jgi:hypothetical protein